VGAECGQCGERLLKFSGARRFFSVQGAAPAAAQAFSGGAIHIELPGRAMISVENRADPAVVRCVLESLRK
jgi:hypothetical protein